MLSSNQSDIAKEPLVSIGIPTFGRPAGLARTLKCLLAQTYQNIEIIISDNATSGPAVDSILKSYASADRRIRIYRQPCNIGPLENFKFVLRKAVGTHFMWAADDDEWMPGFIERCLSLAAPGGSGMTGFVTAFRAKGGVQSNPLPILSSSNSKFKNATEFLSLMQPSLFYGLHRREDVLFILNEVTFDFYDCYFILRIILKSGFSVTDETLYLAGVDSEEYEIKHENSGVSKPFLNYFDFYFRSAIAVISTNGISLAEKTTLLRLLGRTVLGQISHHERTQHPGGFLFMNTLKVLWQKIRRYVQKEALSNQSTEQDVGKLEMDSGPCGVLTYAQSGEDSIVAFIMSAMQVDFPTYLDIGAHHPWKLSNTYRFYLNGSKGVCVEPDPDLHSQFKLYRPNDINLNVGVGCTKSTGLDFFVMSNPTLNTFSEEEARRYESMGTYHIDKIIQVPVLTVEEIIETNFFDVSPDFISIDVEGLDFELAKSIDFARFRPKVLCIETLTYSEDRTESKLQSIIDYVKANDYFVYADTYINTIFVDRASWYRK